MENKRKYLALIENKVEKLDFVFLDKIQTRLSYKNPYFLMCLKEVIHETSNNMPVIVESLSMSGLLNYLNKKAEFLYLNSNISEHLQIRTSERKA